MEDSKASIKNSIILHNVEALRLVEFSNAHLKKSENKVKFDVFKGDIMYQKLKRVMLASTQNLQYSGSNYEHDMFRVTSTQLKVAVLNKKNKQLKIYEADYFLLKPVLKCFLKNDSEDKSRLEKNMDLTLEFGSKTKKKSINSKLKFKSTETTYVDESILNRASQGLTQTNEEALLPNPETDSIIPPQKSDATTVAEIYSIFDIISENEYTALDSEIDIFQNLTYDTLLSWKTDSKYSNIIMRYLELHYQSLSTENAKLLSYLHYMFCFIKLNHKDFRRKDPIPEIPQPFKKKLIDRYAIKKSIPPRMKDKILANAIVLYLNINNFCMDGKLLASSTKVSVKRIISIAYALGCHVHSKKKEDTTIIELKLPLYKYVPSRLRK